MSISVLPPNLLRCLSPEDRKKLGKAGVLPEEAQAKADGRREKELQRACASILRLRNAWFDVSRMDRKTTNQVGRPDFICCVRGRFVAIEVKTPTGNLSPDQERVIAHIKENGGEVFVVHNEAEMVAALNMMEGK